LVSNDETTEEEVLQIDLGLKTKILGYMLVTAGGTSVDMDEVRDQGNKSKGGTGVNLINAAAERGVPSILLCTEIAKLKYWIHPNVIVILFDTYEEYVNRLLEIGQKYKIMYAISAAAVSDFGFEKVEGKIDSKSGSLPPHYELPKVLATWRNLFGKDCYITGFKLHAYPAFKNDAGARREPTKREWKHSLDKLRTSPRGRATRTPCGAGSACGCVDPTAATSSSTAPTARSRLRSSTTSSNRPT